MPCTLGITILPEPLASLVVSTFSNRMVVPMDNSLALASSLLGQSPRRTPCSDMARQQVRSRPATRGGDSLGCAPQTAVWTGVPVLAGTGPGGLTESRNVLLMNVHVHLSCVAAEEGSSWRASGAPSAEAGHLARVHVGRKGGKV